MPEQPISQRKLFCALYCRGHASSASALASDGLDLIPKLAINQGFVLAGVPRVLIKNLTNAHPVSEQLVEGVAVEGLAAMQVAIGAHMALGSIAQPIEVLNQAWHRGGCQQSLKDVAHNGSFVGVDL